MEDKKLTNEEMENTKLSDDLSEEVNGGSLEYTCRKPKKIRLQLSDDIAEEVNGGAAEAKRRKRKFRL